MILNAEATLQLAEGEDPVSGTALFWIHPDDAESILPQFGGEPDPVMVNEARRTERFWAGLFNSPVEWEQDIPVGSESLGVITVGESNVNLRVRARLQMRGHRSAPIGGGFRIGGFSAVGGGSESRWLLLGSEAIPDFLNSPPDSLDPSAQGQQLAAIDLVDQLTHKVEDSAADAGTKAMARAVREYLNVLREFVRGDASETITRSVLASLHALGTQLSTVVAVVGIADLGLRILELVQNFPIG